MMKQALFGSAGKDDSLRKTRGDQMAALQRAARRETVKDGSFQMELEKERERDVQNSRRSLYSLEADKPDEVVFIANDDSISVYSDVSRTPNSARFVACGGGEKDVLPTADVPYHHDQTDDGNASIHSDSTYGYDNVCVKGCGMPSMEVGEKPALRQREKKHSRNTLHNHVEKQQKEQEIDPLQELTTNIDLDFNKAYQRVMSEEIHHIEAIPIQRDYANERGRSAIQNDKRQTVDSNTSRFIDAVAFKNSSKLTPMTKNHVERTGSEESKDIIVGNSVEVIRELDSPSQVPKHDVELEVPALPSRHIMETELPSPSPHLVVETKVPDPAPQQVTPPPKSLVRKSLSHNNNNKVHPLTFLELRMWMSGKVYYHLNLPGTLATAKKLYLPHPIVDNMAKHKP
jgi:hypothetical protein